jgi:hypothetical protein
METETRIPLQGDFSFLACRKIGDFFDMTFKLLCKEPHLWEKLYDLPRGTSFIRDLPDDFQTFYNNHYAGYAIEQYALAMRTMQMIAQDGWEDWVIGVRSA